MGGRYADVVTAVNGDARFGAGPTGPTPSAANSASAVAIVTAASVADIWGQQHGAFLV